MPGVGNLRRRSSTRSQQQLISNPTFKASVPVSVPHVISTNYRKQLRVDIICVRPGNLQLQARLIK